MIIVFASDMLLNGFEGNWSPIFSRSSGKKDGNEDFK
jgi:hypothetical protein